MIHFNTARALKTGLSLGAGVLLAVFATAADAGRGAEDESRPPDLRLLALGDSLVAGYGLSRAQGFTAQLESALREEGWAVTVLDGGVSGDTTAGGRSRLDWVLADDPDAVMVALGANDGLRGLDPADTRTNLDAIVARLVDEEGLPTLLVGMYAPPNLGRDYETAFNSIYTDLATEYDVGFYPFFLEGVAMVGALNQEDGIHPNAQGVAVMVENLLPDVVDLLDRAAGDRSVGDG